MFYYTVAKGDSLWMIAKKFGLSLENLIKANPQIKDPNKIYEGDRVVIPLGEDEGRPYYVVQSGDTMWAIAKKFDVSLNDLILANPQVSDADAILPGQKILLPLSEDVPCKVPMGVNNGALYEVKNGDTLFLIAQRYAMNLDSLRAANPEIRDGDRLVPGMQIYLPGSHYVKNGETLSSIAALYGVELSDVIAVNPQVRDVNRLEVGEKLAIPRRGNGDIALYKVKQGDTLYKIAQKYNVPVESLLRNNAEVIDSDLIYPGQKLRIPGPYILRKGDTFYRIGEIYDVAVEDLEDANPNLDPEHLPVGMMVKIPVYPCCVRKKPMMPASGVDYVVQRGDTLRGIAAMYRVPLKEVLRANPGIKDADRIRPGMVVRIPTGFVEVIPYVVQRGDTIWRIAAKYGISAGALLHANPQLGNADRLSPGDVLQVPLGKGLRETDGEPRALSEYPSIYSVENGDTLAAVAERFGTTVERLCRANEGVAEDDDLFPGRQLIVLPHGMRWE